MQNFLWGFAFGINITVGWIFGPQWLTMLYAICGTFSLILNITEEKLYGLPQTLTKLDVIALFIMFLGGPVSLYFSIQEYREASSII